MSGSPAETSRSEGRSPLRSGLRGAAAGLVMALVLLPALPAAALPNGTGPGLGQIGDVYSPQGLNLPLKLLIFVGIPLVGFVIGGLMAFRPQRGAVRRYRPGRAWTAEPVWFGDESALEHEPQRAALPGAGGASGRW